jgi:hypothetical protein
LLVTNDYGIVGGRDTEDDESYRYRIHLNLTSQSGSNENALRFALLQTPIQDVVFDRRAGTFTCYVYAITPIAAASTLQRVQDTLDQTVAFPITGIASNPDLVGFTLSTTLSLISGTTQTDRDNAIAQANAAASFYLNNLGVGQPLIINDIAAAIRNSSTKILDVGQPNRQIDEISRNVFTYNSENNSKISLCKYQESKNTRWGRAARNSSSPHPTNQPGKS